MTDHDPTDLDRLARDLGVLVRRLVEYTPAAGDGDDAQAGTLLRAHLGEGATTMPVVADTFSRWDQANLQLALDAATAREGWSVETVGLSGQARHFGGVGLGDMMRAEHFPVGPVEHATVDVGPGRTLACIDFAVMLIRSPEGPLAAFVHRGDDHFGRGSDVHLQVVAGDRAAAEGLIADLKVLIDEHDVYRGQLVTLESGADGTRLVFLERPAIAADDVVLPDGALARIERHLVGASIHRERLLEMGRHLSRGLLLWGPPGTGKTLTVRYLTGRLTDCTIIVLSGGSLGAVGAFGTIARRLAPSVVILEDVDLVAEERAYDGGGGGAVLFELMNEMSGHADDADVAFVLTTNRPEALEPALAARPGRIDLAIEIPLPDAAARERLLEIYGRGLDLRLEDRAAVVQRTEGVTASFVKELLRKATLAALDDGRGTVTDGDVGSALDELLSDTAALTRVMLGAGGPGAADELGWLSRFHEGDDEDGGGAEFMIRL